jgi:uncharacterized membrane protein
MLPNPLHPAVVHFPVVLAFLLPLVAIGALWTIRRGARPRAAWSVPLMLAGALALSAWAAVETGEGQSERVERVVGEQPLESHEEMADAFLTASVVLVVVAAARVGHSGGQLVYQHGAASAYATPGGDSTAGIRQGGASEDERP